MGMVFDGIDYKDRFGNQNTIICVTEQKDGCILVLIKNENDHPTLLVINPVDDTFHVEGYD